MRFNFSLLLIIIVVISVSGAGFTQETKSQINWESFNSGLSKAKKLKKPIMIDFYADWCHWCKVMEKDTFSNPEVAKILNRDFVAVRTDIEKKESLTYKGTTYDPKKFVASLGIKGLPTIVLMDSEGEVIDKVPGYIKPEVCIPILKYISEGCYKQQISFDDYMNKKVKCK